MKSLAETEDWYRRVFGFEVVEREELHVLHGGEVHWPHSSSWYIEDPTGYEIEVAHWNEDGVAFGRCEGAVTTA